MTTPKSLRGSRRETEMPRSIDINPTAVCNLRCSFCWGPDHTLPDGLNTDEWKELIRFLAEHGSQAVVFTGGEPLVRNDIGELLRCAHEVGLHVTLSTNTLLLRRRAADVIPYIDEIGIPLDGSSREANARMRLGNPRQFATAIDALHLICARRPNIHATVRTVVSKVNKHDIVNIGAVLSHHHMSWDRWKLYQFVPVSIGASHRDEHEITTADFQKIVSDVIEAWPSLPIEGQSADTRVGRYLFIGPEGEVYGVDSDGSYSRIGSWIELVEGKLTESVREIVSSSKNNRHGAKHCA